MKKKEYKKLQNRVCGGNELQFRAVEGENNEKILEGYAALFNVRSNLLYNSFYEVIERTAFDKLIKREDLDVVFNFNHNNSIVMGRTTNDTLKLSVDDNGLFFRATLPKTTDADNLYELVKRGDISQNSFAFMPAEDGYRMEADKDSEYDLVTVTEIDQLRDVSAVTFPAYSETKVSIRALDEQGNEIPDEEVPAEETPAEETPAEEEVMIEIDEKKLSAIMDMAKELLTLVEDVKPTEEEPMEEETPPEEVPAEEEEMDDEERSLNQNKRIFLKLN